MLIVLVFLINISSAQTKLNEIKVEDTFFEAMAESWEENVGTQIFSGKKNTKTSLKSIPELQTNNYRQAIAQTPGLLVSEIPNESIASLSFRGLGDPHESYNILLLQDGIPVAADMYGYPAHYFSPALPMMNEVLFTRGGASLHDGPQPGGSLNYLSHPLKKGMSPVGRLQLSGGSYNQLTTNNSYYGSKENTSYGVEYYRRQGEGQQRHNSDFQADYVQARHHTFLENGSILKFAINAYDSDHGNAGGFSRLEGGGINTFGKDPKKSTRLHDRLKVSRLQLHAGLSHALGEQTKGEFDIWVGTYRRFSTLQNGGGFGTFPTQDNNAIVEHQYHSYNLRARLLHDWNQHSLSMGYQNYNVISPYTQQRGASADSDSGEMRKRVDRDTRSNSIFLENRFVWGNLFVTPGVRYENIMQSIDERKNLDTTAPLRNDARTDQVALFGLGMSYHTSDSSQLYFNISEAYKPISFTDAIPLSAGDEISDDINPSKILNTEIGHRGKNEKISWDVSLFHIRYENRFGRIGNKFTNTGAATHRGLDLTLEAPLRSQDSHHQWNLYFNTSLLDARFSRGGNLSGKTPMYAPKKVSRAGLIYRQEQQWKVALMSVFMDEHYADDANSDNFKIPYYMLWDLTSDYEFSRDWKINAGINNLLDRQYTSRIRSDGIYQALGRNFYAGVSYQF